MKNFFRKVAYGISPNENVPSDPQDLREKNYSKVGI
jgi:hypothetical protein